MVKITPNTRCSRNCVTQTPFPRGFKADFFSVKPLSVASKHEAAPLSSTYSTLEKICANGHMSAIFVKARNGVIYCRADWDKWQTANHIAPCSKGVNHE